MYQKYNEWYPWGLQISLHIRSPRLQEYDGGAKKRLNFNNFFLGGGNSRVNFGHLKSEVFHFGGGGIPE